MLTLCAMVILSPISANIWSHHQRSSAARHIQSWARYMLARIHVDTRRSNAATYIQSHARHLAARHLATRHRAANCIRWWAIRLMVRVRIYHIRRIHLYATHIQSWSRVLLVKARLFYLRRMGLVYVAAMRVQSVIRGWRIRKRCWPRAKQIDLSTIYLFTIWHLKLGLSFDAQSALFFDTRRGIRYPEHQAAGTFFDIGCGARNPTLRSAEQLRTTQLRVTEAYKRQGVARVLINRNGGGASAKQKRAHKAAAELRWNALEAARRQSEPDGKLFDTYTCVQIFVPTSATHLQSDDLDWDWA